MALTNFRASDMPGIVRQKSVVPPKKKTRRTKAATEEPTVTAPVFDNVADFSATTSEEIPTESAPE